MSGHATNHAALGAAVVVARIVMLRRQALAALLESPVWPFIRSVVATFDVIRYRFALSPMGFWAREWDDFAATPVEEPILTCHFGYDIQIGRTCDFSEATEAGDGASQA